MFYIIASFIIVASAIFLAWMFAPAENDVSKYSRRNVPGLDQHLKSDKFLEEAEALRQIVNRHRAMERKKKEEKKSEKDILRESIDKLLEERNYAMGAAIVPTPDSNITYKDWIHVYGGEKENS